MKLTTALCTGMLVAAPAVAVADNLPYPDFNAIKKLAQPEKQTKAEQPQERTTAEQPQTKAEQTQKPNILETIVESITGRPASPEGKASGTVSSPSESQEAKAGSEPAMGRSVSAKDGAAQTGQQQGPSAQQQTRGGDTSYPDFNAIKKTAEPGKESKTQAMQPPQGSEALTGRSASPQESEAQKSAQPMQAPEAATGRSVSPMGAAQPSQQQEPSAQQQTRGGDTSYPDFNAIKKEPASQPQR